MELTRVERRERVKSFRAEIARRAALVTPKPDRSYSIPNVPFGATKIAPPAPAPVVIPPPRNPEPDYWPEMWFYDLVFGSSTKVYRVEDILRATALEYGVSRADILSSCRTADVVRPRQVAMYLAKTLTLRSLPEIGRRLGGKDHTTILHGVRKIGKALETDSELAARIEKIKASL